MPITKRAHGTRIATTFIVALLGLLPHSAIAQAPPNNSPKMAPLDRTRLGSFFQATTKSLDSEPASATVAGILDDTTFYKVVNVEFESKEAAQKFKTPRGATVYHRFDRFADVFRA